MRLRDILLALLVVAIWGFNFVVIKFSVDAVPPILAAALRFTLAAFPAILFVKPPKTSWFYVAGFGLSFGFALYSFLNIALSVGMPAGLASVVLQVQAFFTVLIAFFVLGERPRREQIYGSIVAFSGIGVIAYERATGASLLPVALTVCAAVAWGFANILSKKAGKVNPIAITVWGAMFAAVPLYVLSAVVEGPHHLVAVVMHPDPWLFAVIAFLAYPATLFGLAVWNMLLSKYPASLVASFTLLVPITGLVSGWLVLGESVSRLEITGGALIVSGLAVTLLRPKAKI